MGPYQFSEITELGFFSITPSVKDASYNTTILSLENSEHELLYCCTVSSPISHLESHSLEEESIEEEKSGAEKLPMDSSCEDGGYTSIVDVLLSSSSS